MQPEFETSSYSDISKVRQTNEDFHSHYRTVNGEVFVVCDGTGEQLGGATAARLAAESIRVFFDHQRYENPLEALRQSFLYANSKITAAVNQSPDLMGMGTTCVAALLRDGTLYHAHVGNSRLYRFSGGRLEGLSNNPTTTQGAVLGTDGELAISINRQVVQPGDVFLLCTDGLSEAVAEAEISQVLATPSTTRQKAERLVYAANEASGADNATAMVIVFEPTSQPVVPASEPVATSGSPSFSNPPLAEPPVREAVFYEPTDDASSKTVTDESVKKTSAKPDIALIVLCGLAALTIGLFIAGWKYITSAPVENSELSTVQTDPAAQEEAAEPTAEPATPDEEDTKMEAATQTVTKSAESEKPKETEKPKNEEKPKGETKPKTEEKPVSVPAGGATHTHTVRAGETFRGIANRYNLKYETLKALNPKIKDVEKDLKSDVTKLNVRVKAVHTVGAGDILSVVARKYDVSKELIMTANKKTADRTERGEKLVIPLAEKQ